jgi:hypothetical protein
MALRPKPPKGTVFVVGRVSSWPTFRIVGAFGKEVDAVGACLEANYFVAPLQINKRYPDTVNNWPGLKYPRQLEGTA